MLLATSLLCLVRVAVLAPTMGRPDHIEIITRDETLNRASIADQIKEALESLREVMLTGSEDIPVLDPLDIEHFHFDLEQISTEGRIDAVDLVVRDLSTFVVNNIQFSALARRLRFDIVVPELVVTAGNLDIDASPDGQYIKANGTASLVFYNVGISGSLRVKIPWSASSSIQIYDVQLAVYLSALQSDFKQECENTDDSINEILEDLIPAFVKNHEKDISDFLNPTVEEAANKLLEDAMGSKSSARHSSLAALIR